MDAARNSDASQAGGPVSLALPFATLWGGYGLFATSMAFRVTCWTGVSAPAVLMALAGALTGRWLAPRAHGETWMGATLAAQLASLAVLPSEIFFAPWFGELHSSSLAVVAGIAFLLLLAYRAFSTGPALLKVLVGSILGLALLALLATSVLGLVFMAVGGTALVLLPVATVVPALIMVAAARRAGRRRPGSLVAGVDRSSVWLPVAMTLALLFCSLLRAGDARQGFSLSTACIMLSGLGVLGLLAMDAVRLARIERIARAVKSMLPRDCSSPQPTPGLRLLDLGLGDVEFQEVLPAATPYREVDRVVRVVRGDPAAARAHTAWAVAKDAAVLFGILAAYLVAARLP